MHFRQTFTALTGLVSLVVAAPAPIDHNTASTEELKNTTNDGKISLLDSPLPLLGDNNIILPGAGLNVLTGSAISQLARIAELELAALVESQFALVIQLETIKTNIRINHFRAQFPQVNCVIMCVTNVLDQRDPDNTNNRYLLNQLRIDNGFPEKELLIMVTDSQQMTIVPTPTAVPDFSQNSINSFIPDLSSSSDIPSSTTSTSTFTELESTLFPQAQPTSSPLNASSAAQPTSSPLSPSPEFTQGSRSRNFGSLVQPIPSPKPRNNSPRQINLIDLPPSATLSSLDNLNLLNQSLLLPFGISAPTVESSLGLVLADPASIILPDQQDVFVDTLDSLQSNCLALQLGLGTAGGLLLSGNAGLGLEGFQGQLFGSLEAALAAQLAGLGLLNGVLVGNGGGLGQPGIPPGIIAGNPGLVGGGGLELVTTVLDSTTSEDPATATEEFSASETDVLTDTATTEEDLATVTDELSTTETDTATAIDELTATETATSTGTEGEVTETVSARARATRRRRRY